MKPWLKPATAVCTFWVKWPRPSPSHEDTISPYAPQIVQIQIDPEFIGKIIGKGGETIRRIQDESGCSVTVDDDGIITLASPDMASVETAKNWISDLCETPEAGKTYQGKVTSVKEFGAFVEFLPGTEGLVHISEWDWARTENMDDVAKKDDEITVKLLDIDQRTGRFKLSRKALIEKPEGYVEPPKREPREGGDRRRPRRDGDRRPRRDREEKASAED